MKLSSATHGSLLQTGCTDSHLRSLCRNGHLDMALHVLWRTSTAPSDPVYLLLLKACTKKEALQHAKLVHIHLLSHSTSNTSALLYDHLVVALAKCGALDDACHVLYSLPSRSVFSWTAVIAGFVELGNVSGALQFYSCMQDDGVKPNHYTFVSLFKACGSISNINQGRKLHDDLRKMGIIPNVYIINALVSMYGKCGNIVEAENVFKSGEAYLDGVSWNAMLSSYIKQEDGKKALQLFRQMHEEGASQDERSFIMALQACNHISKQDQVVVEGQFMSLEICQSLHSDAQKNGFIACDFFVSTLISAYGKCKSLSRVENVFCRILHPDITQWNAVVTAYSELGLAIKVLQAHVQLHKEGFTPDQHTFVISLQACCVLEEARAALRDAGSAKSIALELGEALCNDAWKQGFSSNVFLNNTLVSLYGKCGSIEKAEKTFQRITEKREVSWNAMLSAYVEQGEGEKALQLYSLMQKQGVTPSNITFVIAIQACGIIAEREAIKEELANLACLEIGQALHADLRREGFATDVVVASTLVCMYGKCGMISEAEIVFGGLYQRNVVSWNAMISAFVEQGLGIKASHLFWKMQKNGMAIDDSTLISVLQASGMTGWAEVSRIIHFFLVTEGLDACSSLATTLIHAYGNCALIADAHATFDGLSNFDIVTCSAYLDALVQAGNWLVCLVYKFMQWELFKPDGITFYSILSGCSHAGFIDMGVQCFRFMIENYGLKPEVKHYAVMIDLLGRAGDFQRVKNVLARTQPDLGVWSSLLGVCRLHCNVEMGKQAFDHIVCLKPKDSSAYVLMHNIFADAGMQDRAEQINSLRLRQGIQKSGLDFDEM